MIIKKLLAAMFLLAFAGGCIYYPYRTWEQRPERYTERERYVAPTERVIQKAPEKVPEGPLGGVVHRKTEIPRVAPTAPPAAYRRPAYEPIKDIYFTADLDVLWATDIISAGFGFDLPESNADIAMGMGFGLTMSAYIRARVFLRNTKDSPYLFFGYRYAFETPEHEYEDWDEYYSARYKIEEAHILGYGFGYRWLVDPDTSLHVQFGYHNRIHGGHLEYISGDGPDVAPELFDDVKDYVPGGWPTASFGVELRF